MLIAMLLAVLLQPIDPAGPVPLITFDKPLDLVHGDWKDKVVVENGEMRVRSDSGRGGAGRFVDRDFSPFKEHSPVVWLKLGADNQIRFVRVVLMDAAGERRVISFDLRKLKGRELQGVGPQGWAALGDGPADSKFDLTAVKQVQIQPAWSADPVDLTITRVELLPADGAIRQAREKAKQAGAERQQREQQARQADDAKAEQDLRDGVAHPPDDPSMRYVGAVGRDLLAIEIVERQVEPAGPKPYQPQPGDVVKPDGKPVLVWENGKPTLAPVSCKVFRGKPEQFLGYLVTPFGKGEQFLWTDRLVGTPLNGRLIDQPRAYRISSPDDPALSTATQPAAVFRKSRPLDRAMTGVEQSVLHVVYLKLPTPLKEGASYTITFHAVNTRQPSVSYKHVSKQVRSEAVHASQIGYRPDDPTKQAFLSLWTGTGGAVEFGQPTFELIDADGRSVFSGPIMRVLSAEQSEKLKSEKNHTQTNVYALRFGEFVTPGEYRVHVPGIGTSHPFRIADDAWERAFRTSMQGFLHHRSGIELGPPLTQYRRPRNMHPDDVPIFRMKRTTLEGEINAVSADLTEQLGPELDASKLLRHPTAWGGYMDAGDWDRRSPHLWASLQHLELLELFPDYFEKLSLSVPESERLNAIPDLADEPLYNIGFYRRLQEPDGGVGGGVESTSHPRIGEASWQESLLLGAFAPDPFTSHLYAANAARAARLLGKYDAKLAEEYGQSARRAWDWAETRGGADAGRTGR